MFIRITNPYVLRVPLLLRQRKPTTIHRILLTNAHTPPENKYASKSSLLEATYTDLRKFCGKKWRCKNKKILLLFITENTIRVFLAFRKFAGCPKQFPIFILKPIDRQFWFERVTIWMDFGFSILFDENPELEIIQRFTVEMRDKENDLKSKRTMREWLFHICTFTHQTASRGSRIL